MDTYTGYLRSIDNSFCMDSCSQFYIESESGVYINNLSFNDINPDEYINRYVYVEGSPIWCIECGAISVEEIVLSTECNNPVQCFVDPCEVTQCEVNITTECISSYCGGCYADFYDVNGNLVDCNSSETIEECYDVNGLFFGFCDMYMGVAIVDGTCQGVSGCGWTLDGIDYSGAFFDTFAACEQNCLVDDLICSDIEFNYNQLHGNEYATCEYDNDCVAVWGDCDVGLGGCHYSVNEDNYPEDQINNLVDMWVEGDCIQWACDCSAEPYAQCIDGICTSAYCMSDNPAGCNQTGCAEGYECIMDSNDCTPSSCFCDGFYGDWYCTEDCGGGSCVAILIGDLNGDNDLNISDIVIMINIILEGSFESAGDLNSDDLLNISDIVLLVNLILR